MLAAYSRSRTRKDMSRLFRFPRSIRARLTLWYSLVLGALVSSVAVGSNFLLAELLKRRADRFLRDAAMTFADEVATESEGRRPTEDLLLQELRDYRFREIEFFVFSGGRLLGRSPLRDSSVASGQREDPALDTQVLSAAMRGVRREATFTVDDAEGGFRVHVATIGQPPSPYLVAAVQSWHGYAETQELLALAYGLTIPLFLLLAAVGGYWLASRGLAPVARLGREAERIGRDNLSLRLDLGGARDEIGRLAEVFNDMLERLSVAFKQQERFIQDASHELRSPVAAVRMEAEVSLRQPSRPESEYRESLSTIRRSAIRLGRIVDDLFLLARYDARQLSDVTERIDLGEAVHDAVRSIRPRALERNVRLQLAEPPIAPIRARSPDVERIVVNLVENAVRFSPEGATVAITVTAPDAQWFAVRVADQGSGVDPAMRARIFERFYRGARGGERESEGAGLGLPIARALAESLGGRLELEASECPGATFACWIPRDSS